MRRREALGERADFCEHGEVGELGFDLRARLGGESCARLLGALGIAADDADRRALPGEVAGRSQAETRRCARHDRDLAVEAELLERLPVIEPTASLVTDAGEAADDARLERGVDRAGGVHGFSAAVIPAAAFAPTRLKKSCISGSSALRAPENSSRAS